MCLYLTRVDVTEIGHFGSDAITDWILAPAHNLTRNKQHK